MQIPNFNYDYKMSMRITTFTSKELKQNTGNAKKATQNGQVFITDRRQLTHVLLSIEDYRRLTGSADNIIEL